MDVEGTMGVGVEIGRKWRIVVFGDARRLAEDVGGFGVVLLEEGVEDVGMLLEGGGLQFVQLFIDRFHPQYIDNFVGTHSPHTPPQLSKRPPS